MTFILTDNVRYLKSVRVVDGIPETEMTDQPNRAKWFLTRANAEKFVRKNLLGGSVNIITMSEVAAK